MSICEIHNVPMVRKNDLAQSTYCGRCEFETRMAAMGNYVPAIVRRENSDRADLYDLLVRVSEYLDDRADVRDGEDGPLPNAAMSLGQEVDAALEKLKGAK